MSWYAILVIIWKWLKLLNSVPVINKTLVNHFQDFQDLCDSGKSCLHSNLMILTDFHSFTVNEDKLQNWSIFKISAKVRVVDFDENLKMTKTSQICSILQKTLVNHVYLQIWSSWLTFTVLQWMKTNFKISKFSRFVLRWEYAIQVKIWKWLKLLNSVPSIRKTRVIQVHIRIWSFWYTFTVLQWMKKNSKISLYSRFLLRFWYAI